MNVVKSQNKIVTMLQNSKRLNRISHAYLFSGLKGVGKFDVALYFACMMYCKEETPCFSCDSCKQILNENFVNLMIIRPDGQNIKKEQIIALQKEFSKSPIIDGPRIYIVIDAHRMNASAQNSLLKFIEEPVNAQTYGILLTDQLELILPTIKSRAVLLSFDELKYSSLVDQLLGSGVDSKYSFLLPYISNNLESCLAVLNGDLEVKVIDLVFDFIENVVNDNIMLFYRMNQEVLSNKKNLLIFVNLLTVFYKDCYNFKRNLEIVSYKTCEDSIKVVSDRLNLKKIEENITCIMEVESKLGYNVNVNITVLEMLITLNGGVF